MGHQVDLLVHPLPADQGIVIITTFADNPYITTLGCKGFASFHALSIQQHSVRHSCQLCGCE